MNVNGFSFDFSFYSFEYPEWLCTEFNDQFVVLMDPPPVGTFNGNIAFDSSSNPVSVNSALFEACVPTQGYPCSRGTAELLGTGFDSWANGIGDAGATGWLRTTAPVMPGQEFKIRIVVWDTGDQLTDSTVILDNFQWIIDPTTLGTSR
ncbi:MAG: hypothetical protein GWO23_21045 [Gammaproteobacteria bacterium]|nr:hypothetical protein [Gammaproteobacteria bacterium]